MKPGPCQGLQGAQDCFSLLLEVSFVSPDISFKKNRACSHFVSKAAGGQTVADGGGQGRGEGVERRLDLKNLNSSGLILALSLTCCVTRDRLLCISELHFQDDFEGIERASPGAY